MKYIACSIDYVRWHEQAAKWYRQGLRQSRCDGCQLWLFPAERKDHVCKKRVKP